jgi:hypothetical protein
MIQPEASRSRGLNVRLSRAFSPGQNIDEARPFRRGDLRQPFCSRDLRQPFRSSDLLRLFAELWFVGPRRHKAAHHGERHHQDRREVAVVVGGEGDSAHEIGPEGQGDRGDHRVGDPGVAVLADIPSDKPSSMSVRYRPRLI